ncbi:hypothetical protein LVD15_06155 [Fulvivirga maritima]|uniref:hypothetical protein n=1 Tax=Fulvivirga maritima TaxID=2904247 RepID=UPI001F45607B|nr:hypothetical protein [Fulvivirga maritima]UII28004.1 hypothetical protein LVD15_06155 [Fulvivirga maritima]
MLSAICAFATTAHAQESTFMFEDGGSGSSQSDLINAGNDRSYTSGEGRSYSTHHKASTSYTEGDKENNKKNQEIESQKKESGKSKVSSNRLDGGQESHQKKETSVSDDTNEDPNSVISFNFLHYIIQKFKFSEMVDE